MMNKSQILKKIGNIIEELSEQQQYLARTDKISLLELELFTANADFLIDHVEILKKLNDNRYQLEEHNPLVSKQTPKNTAEPEVAQESFKLPVEEQESERFSFSFDDEPKEMIFDFEKKIPVEEVFDRPLNDDEKRLLEEKSSAPTEEPEEFIVLDDRKQEEAENNSAEEEDVEPFLLVKKEGKDDQSLGGSVYPKVEKEEPVVAQEEPHKSEVRNNQLGNEETEINQPIVKKTEQTFNSANKQAESAISALGSPLVKKDDRPLTLNEMLSAKLNQTAGQPNQRQNKKLEDLKTAISINDKMVFIKELFNGYNLAYSEAIEIVNRFDSFEAADNFLQKNYSVKNDWENKQVTVLRFYEYLHKKFVM